MSEKGDYYRSQELKNTPSTIWDEYSSGLHKYEQTFAAFGNNPLQTLLKKRRDSCLETILIDVAASGALVNDLLSLGLIKLGYSLTLVDPQNGQATADNNSSSGSVLVTGDIVEMSPFYGLPKAQVITFRPVGAFDDYPEVEYGRALSNSLKCLDPNGGILFAQLPVSNHPSENKGCRIVNDLNLGNEWIANISENSYARKTKRNGYFPENTSMVAHSVVMFKRQG